MLVGNAVAVLFSAVCFGNAAHSLLCDGRFWSSTSITSENSLVENGSLAIGDNNAFGDNIVKVRDGPGTGECDGDLITSLDSILCPTCEFKKKYGPLFNIASAQYVI